MAIERTLSIIKPDAVAKNVIGQIYARFEGAGLKVIAAKMVHLSRGEAEQFYGVHKERPFFKDLVDFMVSGPVMIQALEGENAILKNRRSEEHTSELQSQSNLVCRLLLEKKKNNKKNIHCVTLTNDTYVHTD